MCEKDFSHTNIPVLLAACFLLGLLWASENKLLFIVPVAAGNDAVL